MTEQIISLLTYGTEISTKTMKDVKILRNKQHKK